MPVSSSESHDPAAPASDAMRRRLVGRPRVALVTGASSGIGAATARALLSAGFVTYASARRIETLAALAASGCRTLALDVTDEESMRAAVSTILSEHPAVDVLVNNAGYGPLGPLEEAAPTEVRRLFETNVFGLLRLSQLVLPTMRRAGGGRIINVGSMGGEFTTPFGGAYHATKYAVEALSDALRVEVAPFGVDVVLVQPGPVATRLASQALDSLGVPTTSPYTAAITRFAETSRRQMTRGQGVLEPESVASVIVKAAQRARPRARYKVGVSAHALPFLRRWLSDRAWDAMWRRVLGLPARGAAVGAYLDSAGVAG